MSEKEPLFERLAHSPADWDVRIALIEIAIREGDTQGARRLVRASPGDVATPPEIQIRLHSLLTGGFSAPPTTPAPPITPVPAETTTVSDRGVDEVLGKSDFDAGGSGALIEADLEIPASRRALVRVGSRMEAAKHGAAPPRVDRSLAKDKWEGYEGGLELVVLELPEKVEAPSTASARISSVSLALLAHLAVLVVLSLVVIQVQRPEPPQLVVSAVHEREAELITTRLTRPTPEIAPSAASAQAVDVISALSTSSHFNVPDVETRTDSIMNSALPGDALAGTGMSFSANAVDSSDVNFFGLSGSGRKIVFIIDATPGMLVDEKGGMSAYNKVKDEVGVMLANLNRGTQFNLLLYQGGNLVAFRPALVPGLPSNLRQAIEWLDPLNRNYEALGLNGDFGVPLEVTGHESLPIAAGDVAHYTKAVQKALEWQASAIFCITSGYEGMSRAPTPEMLKKMAEMPRPEPGTVDPAAQAAWQAAVAKTREWLDQENAARREKGLDPKVVTNFNQLVQEITRASPPQRRGNNRGGPAMPRMPAVTPEDIETQVDLLVKQQFKSQGHEEPSLHLVLFLGEEEEIGAEEDHFKNLTRKNRGKLKILRGLAALKDVTGTGSE